MNGILLGLTAVAAAGLFATPARGEDQPMQHGGHSSSGSTEMHQQMQKAGREMQSMKMSGDVDRDFVMAMRKHHQDGIAMSKMVLEHGRDPKTREMAQRIIDSQQKDLREFDAWLAEHGGDRPKGKAQARSGER